MLKDILAVPLAALAALLAGPSADAQVALGNDPVFGANSIIRDVPHGQEFLALRFTNGLSYSQVLAQTNPGGTFQGWRVASSGDLMMLGNAANVVDGSTDPAMIARAEQVRDWFGIVRQSTTHIYCRGLTRESYGLQNQKAFTIGRSIYSPVAVVWSGGGWGGINSVLERTHLVRAAAFDSDGDGLPNSVELGVYGTNPNDPDTDHDGLNDGAEVTRGTLPLDSDTDNDGLGDGAEVTRAAGGTCPDPRIADSDADGLPDGQEVNLGIDECDVDSDDDGLADGVEIEYGTDPGDSDSDNDGLDDKDEVDRGTSPLVPDTDDDGLSDGAEVALAAFGNCPDPLVADSDLDGIDDGVEVGLSLNACDSDFDDDGLVDGLELSHGTQPMNPDTDGDGLLDGTEVDTAQGGCPDPLTADSDEDTLPDGFEVALGTDPCNADTDGDSVNDGLDPTPTVPGVTSGFLEDALRDLAAMINATALDKFNAPNANSRHGRRNALANRAIAAANAVAAGDEATAIAELTSLLEKVDGLNPPPDWMNASTDKSAIADEADWILFLMTF